MDCFSPCGLLPSWLGKVMAALWRAVWIVPALGFPCLLCHPEPALYSWHFHPCPAPLPFLAAPSAQPGWELLGCHSQPARREQLRILAALCFWGSSCCRWGFARAAGLCPGPAVCACCSQTATPVLWLTELCSLGRAVSCVSSLQRLDLSYSCSDKVHWQCWCFYYVLSV